MTDPNPKTVRLGRGRHASPETGACVAELVSMLAGEPFSDHPVTACPATLAFLRGYNDGTSDRLRQDLYAIAPALLGTRGDHETTLARARALVAMTKAADRRHRLLPWPRCTGSSGVPAAERAGHLLGRLGVRHPDEHPHALEFVKELVRTPDREPSEASDAPAPTPVT
jgi:hypothetical protein